MSVTLGFSAGVMVMVSFVELLQGSIKSIGFAYANFGFFAGIIVIFLLDFFTPHEWAGHHDRSKGEKDDRRFELCYYEGNDQWYITEIM